MTELDALANVDFKTREVKPEHRTLTIVRIGTCGAIQPDIPLGSFILSHISVGCDGLMNWYDGRDEIALLDFEEAFKKAVKWNKHLPDPYFVRGSEKLIKLFEDCTVKGMTVSASGFYGPQGRVIRMPLAIPDMIDRIESFRYGDLRITNFEMEGSAIAGMARHLGHEAGTVCCAIANRHLKSSNTDYKPRMKELVDLVMHKLVEN
jgi:uridine phosphorylase